MRVLTLNIEGDKHLPRVLSLLEREKPDVICLQELFEEDFNKFRERLSMSGNFFPMVFIDTGGMPNYQERGPMGVGIFTKRGVFNGAYYFKKRGDTLPRYRGLPNNGHRVLVWVESTIPSGIITIATTHFAWSKAGRSTTKQQRELLSLLKLLDQVKPDVLCGDFNAPRGGGIFSTLSKRYVDHIPNSVKTTLDPLLHYTRGLIQLVVDGFFTTPEYCVKSIHLVGGVSDHCAVVGEVSRK